MCRRDLTGRHEARELRDRDPGRFQGEGVLGAVGHVRETIGSALLGRDPFDQAEIDAFLCALDGTEDKSALGANPILAVSMAVARAAAISRGVPLWQHLGGGGALPLPMVNIISGGLHGDTGLAFQDFLVVPVGAGSIRESLEFVSDVRTATAVVLRERGLSTLEAAEGGFAPPLPSPEAALDLLVEAVGRSGCALGDEVAFALDVAASHFFDGGAIAWRCAGRHRCRRPGPTPGATGRRVPDRLDRGRSCRGRLGGLGEPDLRLGARVQIIGDDLFATNAARLRRGIDGGVANAVLVKMNQIGTLSETLSVIQLAREARYAPVISARSGETETTSLPTSPSARPRARSRSAPWPSPSGSRSTTSCFGSRSSSGRMRHLPDRPSCLYSWALAARFAALRELPEAAPRRPDREGERSQAAQLRAPQVEAAHGQSEGYVRRRAARLSFPVGAS